jgi:molybdopterin synthase sulfur carrier subunit
MLTIRFFARLRESAGRELLPLRLPEGVTTVAGLRAHLCAIDPQLAAALASTPGLRTAVNLQMALPDTPIREGDEVAFFPPVTGG